MTAQSFRTHHPAIAVIYFAAMLVFTMVVIHPVYLSISLFGALLYSLYLKGWKRTLKQLAWQIPVILVIAFLNPIFAAVGSTELFRIAARPFYLESLVYGVCFGAMLVAVITWFANASATISSDQVTSLLGGRVPTLALMMSMALRLVPELLTRSKTISMIHEANASAHAATRRQTLAARVRQTSVLMGWTMENSLDTADAMKARGWGSTRKRTTYQRYRFKVRDGIMLAALLALVAASAVLAVNAVGQFTFYPTISGLAPWWAYLPFGVLAFLPLILQAIEELRWMR